MATKNLKEINFDKVEKGSPEEVLLGLKEGKTTYAMVFDTMCKYVLLRACLVLTVSINPIAYILATEDHVENW